MKKLVDKCHFFKKKGTVCNIVCLHVADEWKDCFLIEVENGKEVLVVKGAKEREKIARFVAPNPLYDEITKRDVDGTELSIICELINNL